MGIQADGFFVMRPFVWNKHKDINEPTQKAIILHEGGREDLILQVKYEGPVEEFGWLIPVPSLPTVQKASMKCFYELSRYTQEHLEPRPVHMGLSTGAAKDQERDPVKVIEVKTVGAYEVAVLSTETTGSLKSWLDENQFAFPEDKAGVIDSYIKRHWYFVAVRIQLGKGDHFQLGAGSKPKENTSTSDFLTKRKLAKGELHPLHLSFASEQCVFPLKISSLNGNPSEIQIYVLSREPLIEKSLYEEQLRERRRRRRESAERSEELKRRLKLEPAPAASVPPKPIIEKPLKRRFGPDAPLLYGQVTKKELPRCAKQLPVLKAESWWLAKQTLSFEPEEMRDLEFQPAIRVLAEKLADEAGYDAAFNLTRFGSNAVPVLVTALRSTNPTVRIHAASIAWRFADRELVEQLGALLKDSEPKVRKYATEAVARHWTPQLAEVLVGLLSDENRDVRQAASDGLRHHPEDTSKFIPAFQEMLTKENHPGQAAALRLLLELRVTIPREDLLRLFKSRQEDSLASAYGLLWKTQITCEEAAPLLHNPTLMGRQLGLKVLYQNGSRQAVELAIPMLRDPDERVKSSVHRLLQRLTGQDLPPDPPEKWEQWWTENGSTFTPKEQPSLKP